MKYENMTKDELIKQVIELEHKKNSWSKKSIWNKQEIQRYRYRITESESRIIQ